MMFQTVKRSVLVGILLAAGIPATAQTVAYVNAVQIINESARSEALRQQLRNEFMRPLDDLKKEERMLIELRAQMTAKDSSQSEAAMNTLRKDLDNRQLQYQRRSEDLERDVQVRRTELFNTFELEVLDLIEIVREEKGIGLVFSKQDSGFLAIDPELDLTSEILSRLNTTS